MRKKIKTLTFALLAVIFFVSLIKPAATYAAPTGTATVSAGAESVIAGNTVTINVSINASSDIFVAQFQLCYDNSLFDFVSTTGPAATSSPAGVIPFQYDGDITKTINFTVVFKAKSVGTGSFSITQPTFVSMEENSGVEIAMTCHSASVRVMAVGSDDATLNTLQVAGASLSPKFSKWTTNYTCYVDNAVTSVNIAAISSQGGKVEISGNVSNLKVGTNNITITSYAPNGKTMTYTLRIVRQEPPTSPPETTAPETPPAPIADSVAFNGVSYTIDSSYSSDKIPSGFNTDIVSYNGKDVLAAVSTQYRVTLFYLVNSSQEGRFFLYDEQKQSFFPYTMVDSGVHKYILADSTNADMRPSGCTAGQISVGETDFDALISNADNDFAYFYAINEQGLAGWYCYDKRENTIQRMDFAPDSDNPQESSDEPSNDAEAVGKQLKEENAALKKAYRLMLAAICLLSALLAGLLAILVIRRFKKHATADTYQAKNEDENGNENDDFKNDLTENDSVENDMPKNGAIQNELTENDDIENDMPKNSDIQNDLTENDGIQNDMPKNNNTQNDVIESDLTENGSAENNATENTAEKDITDINQ